MSEPIILSCAAVLYNSPDNNFLKAATLPDSRAQHLAQFDPFFAPQTWSRSESGVGPENVRHRTEPSGVCLDETIHFALAVGAAPTYAPEQSPAIGARTTRYSHNTVTVLVP